MITAHVAKSGGNFDIDRKKLTGKGVYAYEDAERELEDIKQRMALEYELPPYDFIG